MERTNGGIQPSHWLLHGLALNDQKYPENVEGYIKTQGTWKDILKHKDNENDLSGLISLEGLEGTLYSKLSSKAIYKALVSNVFQRPSAQDTIQKRTDRNIDWKKVYMIPRKCTIDSHTRIFQYKILNNILYLNDRLFKMNLVESEMCSFCKGEKETVEHLFLNCRIAKTLWTNICNLCKETMSFPVLSFKNIICGFTESSEQNICQNFVLLLFKKFLYQQRSRQSGANFKSFSNSIHTIYRIEYKIAAANYKLDSHFKK